MGKEQDLAYLRKFKQVLAKEVPVQKMILFGSRAMGNPHRWSDFDLIIVSGKFRNVKFRYRALGFYKHWTVDYPVDFLCYTPEEFRRLRRQVTLVAEAVQHGVEI